MSLQPKPIQHSRLVEASSVYYGWVVLAAALGVESPIEANYTLDQARRTFIFWLFAAGNVCVSALSTRLLGALGKEF